MYQLFSQIQLRIVPSEPADHSDIILEVSAGVGGNEAFLFTQEIFEMYANFSAYKGWNCVFIDLDQYGEGHGE